MAKKHNINRLANQLSKGLGLDPSLINPFGNKSVQERTQEAIKERLSKPTEKKTTVPKKMSKRLAKKLAKTGRTSTTQSIKAPKMPPLTKPSSELPKVGPKPKSPVLPKGPSEGLKDAEAELIREVYEQAVEDKIRLMDILGDYNMFLTKEDTELMKSALESASEDIIERIWNLMPSEDWKDFYKMLSGYYSGIDQEDVESMLDQIAEILGIQLTY